jgi:hypothetical protein
VNSDATPLPSDRMKRRATRELVYDAICVVVFVAIGRRSHHEDGAVEGTVRVAAPFLLGLASAYAVGWRARGRAGGLSFGVFVWLTTLVVGMVLRRTVFDRGTALSFVIVATIFLGLTLVGRRAAHRLVLPSRRRRTA